jgi:hypothetical protein
VVEVRGWDNLRNVLGRSVASTPLDCGSALAANFTLNNPSIVEPAFGPDQTVSEVTAYGGGWGHNVGMSQYGAHGRGRAGQSFLDILNGYYTGADVGSYPIDVGPGGLPFALRQSFVSPLGRGTLEVRNARLLRGLVVAVNGTAQVRLGGDQLSAPLVRVDLTPHLVAGLNVVQYTPLGRVGSATVTVVVD